MKPLKTHFPVVFGGVWWCSVVFTSAGPVQTKRFAPHRLSPRSVVQSDRAD
jgi:hypothetical protein